MTSVRRYLVALLLGLVLSTLLGGCSDGRNGTREEATAHTLDLEGMDRSVAPGDDFYRFANGGWLQSQQIPSEERGYNMFVELANAGEANLHALVEDFSQAEEDDLSENDRKVRDFYVVGMDSAMIEEQGLSPLGAELARIDAAADIGAIQDILAEFQLVGIDGLFKLYSTRDAKDSDRVIGRLWQAGLSLPDRAYYLGEGERHQSLRTDYLAHIARMFELMGDPPTAAGAAAETVLRLETRLAEGSNTPLQNRDPETVYNPMRMAGLESLAPAIDWRAFFAAVGLPEPGDITVGQPPFLRTVDDMMTTVTVEEWKTLLRWRLIHSTAPYLSSEFEEENFRFFQGSLRGLDQMPPRWQRVLTATERALGEALGQLYVAHYFPPEAKQSMLELVENLQEALARRLSALEWMSEATKERALLKLSQVGVKIGYPDHWRDYSALEVGTDSYVWNVLRAGAFAKRTDLAKIGQPVDRGEWYMTPQTVNAYYHPTLNEIVFPAAILQPPFFNPDADDAVNYGAIGFVIGHELSHGFDDQGRRYDGQGNLNDWWSAADSEEFYRRARLLVEQYDGFSVTIDGEIHPLNGELTLGENIADVAGLTGAYDAYLLSLEGKPEPPDRDGFADDQRFFLSAAQIWREKFREEFLAELISTNVHPPGEFRVNGAFFDVPAFYRAFDIPDDGELYRTEEQRPGLW